MTKDAKYPPSQKPKVLYLLTYPRTASNLVTRTFSLEHQPNVISNEDGGYFFRPVVVNSGLPELEKPLSEWTSEERTHAEGKYQTCFDNLWRYMSQARETGKILFVKEHLRFMASPAALDEFLRPGGQRLEKPWNVRIPGEMDYTHSRLNNTIIPDEILGDVCPILLFRHPAFTVPSYYRACVDLYGPDLLDIKEHHMAVNVTLHWTRAFYDWFVDYRAKHGREAPGDGDQTWPVILDGDDVIRQPEILSELCDMVGMDSSKMQFEWTPIPESDEVMLRDKVMKRMRGALFASTGVIKDKAWDCRRSMDEEVPRWGEEFGDRGAEWVEKWVRKSMPDYEYLREKRYRGSI